MFDNYVHVLTPSLLFVTPGIAHRDLKPENILCESPEKVLRTWFGCYSSCCSEMPLCLSAGLKMLYLICNVPTFHQDVAAYTHNPSTQKAETGDSPWVQSQPQLLNETLSEMTSPSKKNFFQEVSLFDLTICIVGFSLWAHEVWEPCTTLIFPVSVLQSSCMSQRQLKSFHLYGYVSIHNYGVVLCQLVSTIRTNN